MGGTRRKKLGMIKLCTRFLSVNLNFYIGLKFYA